MKRKLVGRWFQACLVGSTLAGGCNRQEVPVARTDGELLAPVSAWTQKDPKSTTASTKRVDSPIVMTSYSPGGHTESTLVKETVPPPNIPPVVFADPPSTPKVPVLEPEAPKPLSPVTVSAAVPVPVEPAKPAAQEELAMGMGRYGHAPDYSWLRGEVQHTRRGWHLRYASLDETDVHGGSVTLTDDGKLADLKEGDVVMVKGRLQDPDSRLSSPGYVVTELRPAGR